MRSFTKSFISSISPNKKYKCSNYLSSTKFDLLYTNCSKSSRNNISSYKNYIYNPKQSNNISFPSWSLFGFASVAFALPLALLAYNSEGEDKIAKAEESSGEVESIKKVIYENRFMDKDGKPPIYKVVLTGGPCGGKTTAMSILSDRLRSFGFRVFVVPEAATIVITGGGIYKDMNHATVDQKMAFEGSLMKTKMALEDAFHSIAEAAGEPAVILCDRGTMDTAAYLPQANWEVLLDDFGWNTMNLRDRRYDAVIHLVSAAIGAEKYYTTENNAARSENIDQARELDFRILNAWVGHPNIRIIDNSTDFQEKIKRAISQVCQVIGAPKPFYFKRKYVIPDPDSLHIPVKCEQFEVEQTYLVNPTKNLNEEGFTFIKRRGQNNSYAYSYSMLRDVPEDQTSHRDKAKTVVERQISGREYVALQKQADPSCVTVKKRLKCFIYNNQYFQLSTFIEPNNGITVLEIEALDMTQDCDIPDWLKTSKEVTEDSNFSSYKISQNPKTFLSKI